ncbi:MAG TPA: helix-turn-helix transcriptional regulator [Bauldia sp.]|jgi:predicted transcriptional regulator
MEAITPAVCKAARALVGFTQPMLAEKARVGLSTIHNFEVGTSVPNLKNMTDIISALETAGVQFIEENGGGPGVRLRKGKRK